jgi:hypothetical protein
VHLSYGPMRLPLLRVAQAGSDFETRQRGNYPEGMNMVATPFQGRLRHNPRRRSLTRVTKYVASGGETKTSFRGNSNAFGGKSISSFEVIQRPSAGCFHPCALAFSERFHRSD